MHIVNNLDLMENNYLINEVDFSLEEGQKYFIETELEKLESKAPPLATIKLSLYKEENDSYKVMLRVLSLRKNFISVEDDFDVLKAFERAMSNIKKEISEWKLKRFTSLDLGLRSERQALMSQLRLKEIQGGMHS